MCLGHLSFVKKGLGRTVHIGYKIFCHHPHDELRFQFYGVDASYNVKRNKWIHSHQLRVRTGSKAYKSGFHIYKEKDVATRKREGINSNEKLVKVKYKGVLAEGFQSGCKVVVAKHMWVPQRRKK